MRRRVFIIISLCLGFGLSAGLNVLQHSQAVRQKQALGDQLSDLKQQAKQVRPAGSTLDAHTSPTASPTEVPLGPGQSRVTVSIYHVKLIVADPITDLVYGDVGSGSYTEAGFTTEKLLAQYPTCKAGALGVIVRTKAYATASPSPSPTPSNQLVYKTPINQPFRKTIGGYTYTYRSPGFTCVTDKSGSNAVAAAIAAFKNQALPTLAAQ